MARFFVNRPIVAMVLSIIIVMLGLVAMQGLPIAQYPDIVPPMIQVTTTFIGASATDVEASVATPLEQQINGVEQSIYMKSTNANDGTLTLKVSFEVGSNQDMFSTPLICCSSGVATEASTSVALAPMNVVVTWIIGGTISGYCAIGSPVIATRPSSTVMIEITIATIGRFTKKLAMTYFSPRAV